MISLLIVQSIKGFNQLFEKFKDLTEKNTNNGRKLLLANGTNG